jgi:indole-3-glycerol phosphate synthase
MLAHDINVFLIGEQFMKTGNAGQALSELLAASA